MHVNAIFIICYDMSRLCYAVLLCHGVLFHACHVMPFCVVLCYVVLNFMILYYVM